MKKITSILLVVLLVLTCLTMAACDPTTPDGPSGPSDSFDTAGAREKLDLYIFEQEGQVISGEFVLPGTIGGFDATWTSSSEFVVLTEVAADEDNGIERQYTVKVGYPEAVTEVELTVALSSDVTKTFKVLVNPLTVHDFIEAYSFLQDKGTVVADFTLDRTVDFAGETATIAWSVDEAYTDYIEISEDGNTCVVYPTSLNPTVRIKATFTYEGESATKSYRMTVSEVKDHLQAVDYWYANTGVGMEMKGYVVEIATVYAPSYGNISLYIVDEDFCAGYYLYRVKCDQATADRLVPGAPVVVTGTTNTNYNGLIETNAGGTITIDDSREALTELPVYALDEEVVGGLFSANYHQSTLVSLTNWKVKEVKEAPAAGATSTLFVLEKGGVEVAVAVSKYMEGAYLTKEDDAVWSALAAHGIQVGDIVSVTGVLGNYKGHQIMPLSIDGIVKGDTESTYTAGVTAAAAVKAIDKALADNGLNNFVAVAKNVALPTVDGATITAKVLGASRAVTVVDGAIVVTPGKLENACVQIDVTVGEFKTSIFRYIESADLDDAGKLELEAEAFAFDVKEIIVDSVIDLPTEHTYFDSTNIAWSFKAGAEYDFASIDGNKLTVTLPAEATKITLVATLTLGTAEPVTKEYTIDVAKAEPKVLLTVDTLKLTANSYTKGSTVAGGVAFDYVELGNYGDGIQMRHKDGNDPSSLANTSAIGTGITKIVITFNSAKDLYAGETFTFKFGTAADNLTHTVVLTTAKDTLSYTITPDAETYTFFSMLRSFAQSGSFYATRIEIFYAGELVRLHEHNYVWTDKGDGTCSAACNGEGTCSEATLPAEEHADKDVNGKCDRCEATVEIPETATTIAAALAAKEGNPVEIEATVSEITEAWSSFNNMSFYISDGTNKILVYRTKTQVNVGDKVKVVGNVGFYKGTAQIAQGSTVTVTEAAPPVEPTKVTTIADALKAADGAEAELSGTVTGIYEAWSSYNNMSFYISDGTNKILVFRTTTQVNLGDKVSVVGTVTIYNSTAQIAQGATTTITEAHVCSTYTDATCSKAAECTVCGKENGEALGHTEANNEGKCDRCGADLGIVTLTATAAYTGTTTGNMTGGNDAATLGLDATIFSAVSEKTNSGQNHVGLNKAGNIRLYKGETSTLTISIASGYKIVSVEIVYAASTKDAGVLVVTNGTDVITGANDVYTVNGSKVVLSNSGTDQVHIASIVITYAEA